MANDTTAHPEGTPESSVIAHDRGHGISRRDWALVSEIVNSTEAAPDTVIMSNDTWLRTAALLHVPRPKRAGRRRSRQCRGRRARNYNRAVMREADGSHANSQLSKVVADAAATGALAAARRLQERLT